MHVKVSRLCSVRKGKWKNDVFFPEILQVQKPKPHVSQGGTAIGYAGIQTWRMRLAQRWRLQGCDLQQQKALSPDIQLENTIEIWQEVKRNKLSG